MILDGSPQILFIAQYTFVLLLFAHIFFATTPIMSKLNSRENTIKNDLNVRRRDEIDSVAHSELFRLAKTPHDQKYTYYKSFKRTRKNQTYAQNKQRCHKLNPDCDIVYLATKTVIRIGISN
ncbi:hypothetical protein RF11_15494 [Thelohanellus kitauei]|uniref:Uncharacterized protein n=1 Tax=Thelohanellus kitauei TaxID=669202 RepID=A0A0C2MLX3_THEKT|nr:hypothetical protein RF11_15494 [Thelohanellus kitauei]